MAVLLVSVFSFTIQRDIQIEKQYPVDLRNRIVGARLQMDGKLPYFYNWKPGDAVRYSDPIKFDTTYSNAVTATPFFHHLLYPIANLPQRQISRIWLFIEYLMYILCLTMAFSFTKNMSQRWAVLIVGSLFIFTEAWTVQIYVGQIYLVFAFLAFTFFYSIRKNHSLIFIFLAGLAAVSLVLSRPTTILLFVPFLFILNRYSFRNLIAFFIPIVLLTGYSFLNKKERSFWLDYQKAIYAHIAHHQDPQLREKTNAFQPMEYQRWEGWDRDLILQVKDAHPYTPVMEYAGIQTVIFNITGKRIPYKVLEVFNILMLLVLLSLFYLQQKRFPELNIAIYAIFGFCLYMTVDFFSPVVRYQYYTVQWVFPVFVMAAFYNNRLRRIYVLIVLGTILNIINSPMIKMRHSMGEYLILITLLWMCLNKRSKFLK